MLVDVTQVVVELQANLTLPRFAAQRPTVHIHRLGTLVGLHQQARFIQQLLIGGVQQADILRQQQCLTWQRLQRLQTL